MSQERATSILLQHFLQESSWYCTWSPCPYIESWTLPSGEPAEGLLAVPSIKDQGRKMARISEQARNIQCIAFATLLIPEKELSKEI